MKFGPWILMLGLGACGREPPRRQVEADAMAPADAAPAPPKTNRATANVQYGSGRTDIDLAWGFATPYRAGLEVMLYSTPIRCADVNPLDSIYTPVPDWRVKFSMPAGPGGHYYVETPVGVQLFAEAPSRPLLASVIGIRAAAVTITLDPFRLEAGARIRGTVDAAGWMGTVASLAVRGSFDVELCYGPGETAPVLRERAPTGTARGVIDGETIRPRSIHALLHEGAGGSVEIGALNFYDQRKVACGSEQVPLVSIMDMGGTDRDRHVLRVAQPALARVATPGHDQPGQGQLWAAWVEFEELAFVPGQVVRGSLWADSAPWHVESLPEGTFGGRFEAVVCPP